MFGINGAEALVLLLVAVVVVGPERLPHYAEQLGRWVRSLRRLATDAKDRLASELGETELDWTTLDPRRYDPRRIVRDALFDDQLDVARPPSAPSPPLPSPGPAGPGPAPFDDEAT